MHFDEEPLGSDLARALQDWEEGRRRRVRGIPDGADLASPNQVRAWVAQSHTAHYQVERAPGPSPLGTGVNPLYAIFLYGKQEQANLTPQQKREVAGFAATIKAAAKVRRIKP